MEVDEDKGAEADDEKDDDDDVDPLDAFMMGVQEEVQKIKANDRERLGLGGGIVKANQASQNGAQEVQVRCRIVEKMCFFSPSQL